jgi:DNA-binding beta-propeller fold protein YncE
LERLAVGRAPYAVAANPASHYVLVANAGSDSVTAINRFDSASRMVVSLGGLGYPQQITTDPYTAEFYVSYLISPKESAIAVIDGETCQIVRILSALPALESEK